MELADKHITIIGLGQTSLALVKLLLKHGAVPFVSESKPQSDLVESVATLNELGVPHECGGHTDAALSQADLLIPSPGVSYEVPIVRQAIVRGIDVCSELELASQFIVGTIIAVTGTNGKTTTTELITHLLKEAGKSVALAGNNATPCSALAASGGEHDYVVLEVSSYQLEGVRDFRPDVSVVLNLTNDHLGRHKTMEQYAACKARIMMNQEGADVAVLNFDDEIVRAMGEVTNAPVLSFGLEPGHSVTLLGEDICVNGEPVAKRDDSPLPGRHNTENILAAVAVASALELDSESVCGGLKTFAGVEHRIERVAEIGGVIYYNDSKATNLDSLRVALESFDTPLILIAGGEGKGSDYNSIADLIKQHVKAVVVIGTDAPLMESAWSGIVPVSRADSMDAAVRAATDQSESGDTVVLSPACASFDMYNNFEERGRDFKQCVHTLAAQKVKA